MVKDDSWAETMQATAGSLPTPLSPWSSPVTWEKGATVQEACQAQEQYGSSFPGLSRTVPTLEGPLQSQGAWDGWAP